MKAKVNSLETNRSQKIRLKTGKICKMGTYSAGIIAPKVWLENACLRLGDSVVMEMEDDRLIIQPDKKEYGVKPHGTRQAVEIQ